MTRYRGPGYISPDDEVQGEGRKINIPVAMSESAGRVVGYQYRWFEIGNNGWSLWYAMPEIDRHAITNNPNYETRALVPDQLLVECERERDAWRDFAKHQEVCAVCAEAVRDCIDGTEMKNAAEGVTETPSEETR